MAGVRTGQKIRHELPLCRDYVKMVHGREATEETRSAFMKLATALNRPLEEDPHLSWKEKEADPKLFSGGGITKQPESSFVASYVDVPEEKPN